MAEEEYLSFELRKLLEGYTKIEHVQLALEAYCALQDERVSIEQKRSEKLKANFEKIYQTYLLLQSRHKSLVEKFEKERNELRETIDGLRVQDHNQVSRLRDELEVLKIQLEVQENQHKEEISKLKQQHSDEILKYKMLLNTKQTEIEPKKKKSAKNPKKKVPSLFRWPELKLKVEAVRKDIEKNQLETRKENEEKGGKKRKLFSEDREVQIDVLQMDK